MNKSNMLKLTAAAAGAVFAGAIGSASAAPAFAQPLPSYSSGTSDETIRGTVAAINGPYNISVRDERGFVDNVNLHQGTIINPTGLSLAPGLSVTILGHNDGSAFSANEIDTPW
jgi:invasion protein IalB